ncbi:MAG TPA: DUF1365 domain-containing protein [Caulobacteraceae bacterium]
MSALYDGAVVHQRFAPKRHRLRYRIFQLLLDLDELPELSLRLLRHNRFGLFGFHDRDHGAGDGAPLRAYAESVLARAGIDIQGGAIRLLCMPRVLGYVFNPLSIYYCHRRDGVLAATILEVTNTFGERHSYVVPADADGRVKRVCPKTFFVSPFMGMDMAYDFKLAAPAGDVATAIVGRGPSGEALISAAFAGARQDLTDASLARAFVAHPLMTLKVIAAIHWEAAKLVAKGIRLVRKPAPPVRPLTVLAPLEADPPAAHQAQAQRRASHVALVGRRRRLQPQQAKAAEIAVGEQPQIKLPA